MGEPKVDQCPGCGKNGTLKRRPLAPDEVAGEARKVAEVGATSGVARWESRAWSCSGCGHALVHTQPGGKAGKGISISFPTEG